MFSNYSNINIDSDMLFNKR